MLAAFRVVSRTWLLVMLGSWFLLQGCFSSLCTMFATFTLLSEFWSTSDHWTPIASSAVCSVVCRYPQLSCVGNSFLLKTDELKRPHPDRHVSVVLCSPSILIQPTMPILSEVVFNVAWWSVVLFFCNNKKGSFIKCLVDDHKSQGALRNSACCLVSEAGTGCWTTNIITRG